MTTKTVAKFKNSYLLWLWGADLKEMTTLLFAEKSQRVYGTDVVSEMTGKDPELAPIEASWPHLDSEQRAILIDIAKGMASRNRENTSAVDAMFAPEATKVKR